LLFFHPNRFLVSGFWFLVFGFWFWFLIGDWLMSQKPETTNQKPPLGATFAIELDRIV
jgi:hypothetical protein